MATFRHEITGKRFLFVHIPRTGGRFVEANLIYNNNFAWDDAHRVRGSITRSVEHGKQKIYDSVDGVEIAHFHRPLYEKYLDVQNIPHISIVRNPIDRFISSSIYLKRIYGNDIQATMEDTFMFSEMLRNFPSLFPESANWFRQQVDFMTNNTHIWKFEDGLGKEYVNWLNGILDMDLEFDDDVEYPRGPDEHNKLDKTPALIDNIKLFFRRDIETFYPELAT